MNCPRCHSEVAERAMGTGRAATCGSCGGAWIPFGCIEMVMPRLAELAPGGAVEPPPAGDAGDKLKCPECGGDLVTVKSGEVRGLAIRTCLVCFGRWVDGGELGKLKRRGLLARFFDLFRSGEPGGGSEGSTAAPGGPGPAAEESARTEAAPEEEDRN
jgi:Zn-finger nucleic acid-binding protein